MEMAPMMTQPQEITSAVPGMPAAGSAAAGQPRLSATPLLFAALLQGILPEAQGGAEAAETAVTQVLSGKDALPGKGAAGGGSATGLTDDQIGAEGQASGQTGGQLAKLLAMAGQLLAGQALPKPSGPPAESAGPDLQGGPDHSPGLFGADIFTGTAAQQAVWANAIAQGQTGKPAQSAGATVSPEPGSGRMQSGQSVIGEVQPQTIQANIVPITQNKRAETAPQGKGTTEKPAPGKSGKPAQSAAATVSPEPGSDHMLSGQSVIGGVQPQTIQATILPFTQNNQAETPPQDRGATEQPAPGQSGKPAQSAAAPVSPEPGSGQMLSGQSVIGGVQPRTIQATILPFTQNNQAETAPQGKGANEQPAPGQSGKPTQSASAKVSPEPGGGQMLSGQSVFGGVQPQVMQSSFLPQTDKNWTDASQQGRSTDAQTMKGQSNRTEANKVDYVTLAGLGSALQAGMEAVPQKDARAAAGTPASLQVEVVFRDPSISGKPSEGNDNRKQGDKENNSETGTGLGITSARTFDMPDSSRFSLQPKAEEQKNQLHESILEQVKATVVSHDSKGNGMITVRLSPKELGDLQVNVRIENQQVKVEIITDNRTVRNALMGNLENLKETFLKQNLNIERFDVSTGAGNGFGQGFRGDRGDQRHISSLPFSHEAVPLEIVRENGEDGWGTAENSLVNLRL